MTGFTKGTAMGDWSFFPKFLLRGTGFPIERLVAVAGPDGAEDVGAERRRLFLALADDRAREALMTSAPLVDQNFEGWRAHAEAGRRNAQDKKRERVLWRFLQRLTAKNDSTSFFGAVALGDLSEGAGQDMTATVLPIEVRRKRIPLGPNANRNDDLAIERERCLAIQMAGRVGDHGQPVGVSHRDIYGGDASLVEDRRRCVDPSVSVGESVVCEDGVASCGWSPTSYGKRDNPKLSHGMGYNSRSGASANSRTSARISRTCPFQTTAAQSRAGLW